MAQQYVVNLLKNLMKDEVIRGISQSAGTKVPETQNTVKMAMPQIIEALAKNSSSNEGAESLNEALDQHKGSVLENILGAINDNNTQTDGQKILQHVFGQNEQEMISKIASSAGISSGQASGILNTVAPLIMESIGKTKQEQGLGAGDISGMLMGLIGAQVGSQAGNSLLVNMLDQNKDGDYRDDLFAMLINWFKGLFSRK